MMRGMFAAISGLRVNQTMLDVTANDLSNVNTIGYKSARVSFADALTEVQRGASGATGTTGGTNPVQIGLGVQLSSIDNLMNSGSLQSTGNPLDVAIQGPGLLRVGGGQPPAAPPYTTGLPASYEFTRAGNLTTNTKGFLTTQGGLYVVGRNAVATTVGGVTTYAPGTTDSYIDVPPGSSDLAIGQDGGVSYVDQNTTSPTYQQRVTAGYIALATFPNQSGLQRTGGSLWTATANSGAAVIGTPGTTGFGQTIAGELEMSNVDLASEFTSMITAERGYQANSRVITTADEMLQDLVNMKR
jgi:flagellar hook protein FlgE